MTNKLEGHRTSPPDFLAVEESADVLRIGRTSAYRQARGYLGTHGAASSCAGHERPAYQSGRSRDIFAGGSSDLIVSLSGVTNSAFGTGVFGESYDEQA